MSLKSFHLLFISVSCVLCLGLGVWGIRRYILESNFSHLWLGVLGFVLAVVLVVYELWFMGKNGPLAKAEAMEGEGSA